MPCATSLVRRRGTTVRYCAVCNKFGTTSWHESKVRRLGATVSYDGVVRRRGTTVLYDGVGRRCDTTVLYGWVHQFDTTAWYDCDGLIFKVILLQQLVIKEYFMKIFPRRLHTFRVNPYTHVSRAAVSQESLHSRESCSGVT